MPWAADVVRLGPAAPLTSNHEKSLEMRWAATIS